MKKYAMLAKNTLIFALGNVLSKLILSLLLPLYTRTLTTAEYGIADLITSYTQLIIPVASLSVGDALFRFTMDKNQNKKVVLTNTFLVLGIGSALLFIVMPLLGELHTVNQWSFFLVLISVLSMWRSVFSLYAKAIGKTAVFAVDNIIFNLILAGSNFVFLLQFNLGIPGYFYSQVVANAFSILFLIISNKILTGIKEMRASKSVLKSMLLYSIPLIMNSISWGIMGTADRYMLTRMIDDSANGIYAAAAKIPSLLSLITGVFTQAWALSAIQDYEEEKDNAFYENVFKITHIGVTVGVIILFICNNTVLPIFLGSVFEDSAKYVPCLLLGALFLTYSNFFTPLFSAVKNTKILMISAVLATVGNIVINYLCIPLFGIMGACLATAFSYLIIVLIRFIKVLKLFKLELNAIYVIISNLLLVVCGVLVTFTNYIGVISSLLLLLAILFFERKMIFILMQKVKGKLVR